MPKVLDRRCFERDLKDFVEKSDEIFDGWTLQSADFGGPTAGGGRSDQLFAVKQTTVAPNSLKVEHHIVYCPSYQVPVMYFRVYDSKGQLLFGLESVLRALGCPENPNVASSSSSAVAEGLTQMPHPIYQTPYLQIHPCKTAEWMESVFVNSTNYILSWLSYVGPHVGINLDNHYFNSK